MQSPSATPASSPSPFSDFEEADRKYRQLEIALGGGEAFDKVSGTISELSRQTLKSKDS